MASRKRKRLSVWGVLVRLGHRGDYDDIIQHVFEAVGSLTIPSPGDGPLRGGECAFDGDALLVEVFEGLGATKTWPPCGSPEWVRLRFRALTRVVKRLGREGLLDCVSVGAEGTPASSDPETGKPTDAQDGEQDGGGSETTDARDGEGEREGKTPAAKDDNPDPRIGVQVGRVMSRRGRRNPEGWFRCADRVTPYRVIVRWAEETCPGVPAESLVALLDALREVRWWDDDGHIIGGEMLRVLEAEIEEGCCVAPARGSRLRCWMRWRVCAGTTGNRMLVASDRLLTTPCVWDTKRHMRLEINP